MTRSAKRDAARLPLLAAALCVLAAPLPAQESQPETESEETRPTNQTSQFTTEGQTEANMEAAQPEDAMGEGDWSQGGTGALVNAEGQQLGNVSVEATASGHALVLVNAEGFPEGILAVHLHEFGRCDGPDFETAGGHIHGGRDHGFMADRGPHPGDLPNQHVGPSGILAFDAVGIGLTMDMVFDDDASALIVHAGPDDYTTQPSGNSGDRIACAVIEPGAESQSEGSEPGEGGG